MKQVLVIAFLLSQAMAVFATAAPIPLKLSFNKTTILIFPARVLRPDVGSADVLLQPVEGAANMVRVKAAIRGFDSTNMHIVTADGKLYAFTITYADNADQYEYDFRDEHAQTDSVQFNNPLKQSVALDTVVRRLAARKGFKHHPGDENAGVKAWVTGIYYASDLLFVKVKLKNTTYVPYVLDFTRSTIASTRRLRQKAVQETELQPVLVYNPDSGVGADTTSTLMFVYDKFTLSSDKRFTLHLYEKGERHLKLSVKSNRMRAARVLADNNWK